MVHMADDINKVVILGSGPAGLTAALYTARANLSPLLIEGHEPGGQLTITTEVENYPGFPNGVQGPELMELFRPRRPFRHALGDRRCHGGRFGSFRSSTSPRGIRSADSLIIATGATAKRLGIASEKRDLRRVGLRHLRRRVLQGPDSIVVGGGDTAMEEATS